MKITRKNSIILSVIIVVAIVIITSFSLYGFFNFSITKNDLNSAVSNFCKNSLGRAVIFDNVYITFSGDIIIENFNLSASSDFNDNLSLIKAKTTIFHLDFFELLSKTIKIKGVDFLDSEIYLQKSYGKTYTESFQNILDLPNALLEPNKEAYENFEVNLNNGVIFYSEFFKEEKLEILLTNIKASFDKNGNTIKYYLNGRASPNESSDIGTFKLVLDGTVYLEEKSRSSNKIKFSNLDLSSLNPYIVNHEIANIVLSGGLSSKLKIDVDDQSLNYSGEIEMDDVSILLVQQDDEFPIISKGNFEVEADVLVKGKELLDIKTFELNSKSMDIIAQLKRIDTDKEKTLSFTFDTGNVNLSTLSKYLSIQKDTHFKGNTSWNGDIFIDYLNDSNTKMIMNGSLNDFSFYGLTPYNISKTSIDFSMKDRAAKLSSSLILNQDSDLKIELASSINSFVPPKSDSTLTITSKKFASSILSDLVSTGVISIFDLAYEDMKKGYGEEQSFLRKPISAIINNNNIDLDWNINQLHFTNQAALSNYKMDASLNKGFMRINNFNLTGYDAQYRLEFSGDFARDYPYFRLKFGVNNFDLEKFSADMNTSYKIGGTFNIDGEYSLGAYRMFHFLQNTLGNISLNISDGEINGLKLQKDVHSWLNKNGYNDINLNVLNVSSFNITFTQTADRFSVHRFSLNSDIIDLQGYGGYDYKKGLSLPLSMNLHDTTGMQKQARLSLIGPMMHPSLSFNRKDSENLKLVSDNI